MDAAGFLADLEAKPERLGHLAERLDRDGAGAWSALPDDTTRLLLVGMGSSFYAASIAAARLRRAGLDAVAERASSDLLPPPRPDTPVVLVSAGGGSRETRQAAQRYLGHAPVLLLTNGARPDWAHAVTSIVPMAAGVEVGGVACRSYQHTLVMLLALEQRVTGGPTDLPGLVRDSARASADLLDRRSDWLPAVRSLLLGPAGTHLAAPAHRLSSALQGALMLREGPRLPAVGCEVGDWSHVDVYLTKSTDYRLLLLPGSPWEDELLSWCTQRGSTVVAVGADPPGAALSVRYAGDETDDVRLLTEVLVAELVAHSAWADQP